MTAQVAQKCSEMNLVPSGQTHCGQAVDDSGVELAELSVQIVLGLAAELKMPTVSFGFEDSGL